MKKHTLLKLLLASCLAIFPLTASAANYYASPTGTGTGTLVDPCSFPVGLTLITTPGDTLFLRGGQYDINVKISINKIGLETARICIFAFPGETPILDFRGEIYGQPGISLNASSSYMHIKGLTVRYAGDNGIVNNGNNHIIENCVFYGNCDSGLQHKDGGGNLIKNCDAYENFDYQTGGTATPNFGGNADGFADKQFTNSVPNTYEGCRSWRNSDDGWDLYQRIGHIIIKNSICYQNGPATYDMTNHPRATTDAAWFANFTAPQLAAYTNYGNANGFKVGGDYRPTNSTLTNCLAAENRAKGFDQNNSSGAMILYNCTSVNNLNKNYGFYDRASDNTNVQTPFTQVPVTHATLDIKNCVSLNPGTANTFTSATYLETSNNTWNTPSVTCDASDFISTDASVILSARKTDGSLADIVFMQLATGSDLIDAGANVSLAFSGIAPDLGCYELGNLDNFPAAVTTPSNTTQTIVEGNSITDIVYTWSAGATGLDVTGLPAGIAVNLDEDTKTLTLSGTPTQTGIFNYTVTSIGGSGAPVVIPGKLTIGSASAKKIAYVTISGNAADVAILNKLQANIDFLVTLEIATTVNDYSGYDLIIMSPAPGSSSAGLDIIEGLDKPKLLMKPFQLKTAEWNWISTSTAINTALTSVKVSNKSHEIFSGLTFSGVNNDSLTLFSVVTTNGVTGVNASTWVGLPAITPLALAAGSTTTQSIVEIPIGTNMNGTTTTQRFLMIGVSEASTANLTATGTQLLENACYYLLGMPVPTAITNNKKELNFNIIQTQASIEIEGDDTITGLEIYSTTGTKITTSNSKLVSTAGLSKGVYLLCINTISGSYYKKFIQK